MDELKKKTSVPFKHHSSSRCSQTHRESQDLLFQAAHRAREGTISKWMLGQMCIWHPAGQNLAKFWRKAHFWPTCFCFLKRTCFRSFFFTKENLRMRNKIRTVNIYKTTLCYF